MSDAVRNGGMREEAVVTAPGGPVVGIMESVGGNRHPGVDPPEPGDR